MIIVVVLEYARKRRLYDVSARGFRQMKKIKPEMKIADKMLDLKTMDTNIILNHLDEQITLREMPIEKRLKKELMR